MEKMVKGTNLIVLHVGVHKKTGLICDVLVEYTECDNLGNTGRVIRPFKELYKKTTKEILEDRFNKLNKEMKYGLGRKRLGLGR